MKSIKVLSWKAKLPSGEEVEEDTLVLLSILIKGKKPEDMPKGLDYFRQFNRIAKAFDEATKTKELVLEESDYLFLKKTIENEIPAEWGMNTNALSAIEEFLK